ncbi:MAG: hypothetical protein OEY77_01495 [Nitrospira sp.]|nr:hypothetical protein [Nitrospira sp.]
MSKTHVIVPLIALVGLLPTVVMADVDVRARVTKQKDIRVQERINIDKRALIDAQVRIPVEKAAESQALVNQTNWNNAVCTNCDEKRDIMSNSGNFNNGVLKINQAAGNMNNQGNAVSIAVDVIDPSDGGGNGTPRPFDGFTDAQAHVDQKNFNNVVETVNILFRDARIEDSLNDNKGVVHANQAPGNMANQSNAFSLAVSLARGGVALAEADLGQVNRNNRVRESDSRGRDQGQPGFIGINKRADIVASINGNTGVVGVNQSAGNMANQANVVSFSSTGFGK